MVSQNFSFRSGEAKTTLPSVRLRYIKGITLILIILLLMVISTYFIFQQKIIPYKTRQSAEKNVELFNSLYDKSSRLGKSIVDISQKPVATNAELISKVDSINLKQKDLKLLLDEYIEAELKIDRGFDQDTQNFASVSKEAMLSQYQLMSHFDEYVTYQICLISNGTQQALRYDQLISKLNGVPSTSEILEQKPSFLEIRDITFDLVKTNLVLDTCFSGRYTYLYTEEIKQLITLQSDYYLQLQNKLTEIIDLSEKNEPEDFQKAKILLGEAINDYNDYFFTSDTFAVIRTQPIEAIIQDSTKAEQTRQKLDEEFEAIKKKL